MNRRKIYKFGKGLLELLTWNFTLWIDGNFPSDIAEVNLHLIPMLDAHLRVERNICEKDNKRRITTLDLEVSFCFLCFDIRVFCIMYHNKWYEHSHAWRGIDLDDPATTD